MTRYTLVMDDADIRCADFDESKIHNFIDSIRVCME